MGNTFLRIAGSYYSDTTYSRQNETAAVGRYTVHSTQYTVRSTQYTVHSTQYTVQALKTEKQFRIQCGGMDELTARHQGLHPTTGNKQNLF